MKIVGQLVCGPGEAGRYLAKTLDDFKRLCDEVVVCLCNAGAAEKALVRSYNFRSYEDNREWGIDQPYIKTRLLKTILLLEPDWILALDSDETMLISRAELEKIAEDRDACFFYIINLWNDRQHYSEELSFWNIRFYRAGALQGAQFLRKSLHCGNAPPYFYDLPARKAYVPYIVLHTGLMEPKDRQKKVERYNKYDPLRKHKGEEYYEALVAGRNIREYNEDIIKLKVKTFYEQIRK